jgi:putative heme iron utilization protein
MLAAHLNGGFARAADLKAADVMTDVSDAADLIEAEPGAVAHMNADHADAVRLYATKLLNADGPGAGDRLWRLTGLDPDGLDLACGDAALRLPFPQRVTNAAQLREMMVALAKKARGT